MALIRMVAAAAVLSALAATGSAALASGAPGPPARAAQAGPLSAQLRASDQHPRQFHGVLLDASASTGDISTYVFHYGDGVVDTTYQPLAMHGYQTTGTFHATVVISDSHGQEATSLPVTIDVRDGIPPTVTIDSPQANQQVRLGRSGVRLTGTASDPVDGVKRVALAIQLIHSHRHFKTKGNCVWYDGHRSLALSACSSPVYFAARYAGGQWSFRIDPHARIPAGTYEARVVGIDHAGNISHYYAISLKTVVPFELLR
jgi:hypothetical protein